MFTSPPAFAIKSHQEATVGLFKRVTVETFFRGNSWNLSREDGDVTIRIS
jgi:hypothetical protein